MPGKDVVADASSVAALQRLAGNRAVASLLRRPTSDFVRVQRSFVSDLFDPTKLVPKLNLAIARKERAAVDSILRRLQRDPEALSALKAQYRAVALKPLEEEIVTSLGAEGAAWALKLLSPADPSAAVPEGDAELAALAQDISGALTAGPTLAVTVLEHLSRLRRNSGLAQKLCAKYHAKFNVHLRDEIGRIIPASKSNALYLLGDSEGETAILDSALADRAFSALAKLTFPTDSGPRPVPFHYPVDGCTARAHLMAAALTQAGIASEKVFATSTTSQRLVVQSDFSADQPEGNPTTTWLYHVAPLVKVQNFADKAPEETVLDPSMEKGPVPLDTWLQHMSPERFTRLSHDALLNHVKKDGEDVERTVRQPADYPANEQLTWTTGRHAFWPGERGEATSAHSDEEMTKYKPKLVNYAKWPPYTEAAAELRRVLRRPDAKASDAAAVLRRARATSGFDGSWFLHEGFPTLNSTMFIRFGKDYGLILDAVGLGMPTTAGSTTAGSTSLGSTPVGSTTAGK